MKRFFAKILVLFFVLLTCNAHARTTDTLVHGTRSAPDGERYRTASAKIKWGPLWEVGTQMITGDAGPDRKFYTKKDENGNIIYIPNPGYNLNSHRMGIFYFRAGPISIGRNSEEIRHIFQNRFAHDFMTGGETKWFEVLSLKPRWFWQFGGSGLW
jgi:hypothetical protein